MKDEQYAEIIAKYQDDLHDITKNAVGKAIDSGDPKAFVHIAGLVIIGRSVDNASLANSVVKLTQHSPSSEDINELMAFALITGITNAVANLEPEIKEQFMTKIQQELKDIENAKH